MSYLGPLPGGDQICPVADTITWAFSVATNVACTSLIAFKAWYAVIFQLQKPG
jgi:hypothetical protein